LRPYSRQELKAIPGRIETLIQAGMRLYSRQELKAIPGRNEALFQEGIEG
jgi:hypothetical protein